VLKKGELLGFLRQQVCSGVAPKAQRLAVTAAVPVQEIPVQGVPAMMTPAMAALALEEMEQRGVV
jgi:hypothetical protein